MEHPMQSRRKENSKSRHMCAGLGNGLLDMAVIVDMVFAVTVVALTAGAVPELQFRVADIGFAADGAAMGIVCLGSRLAAAGGIKLDYLGPLGRLLPESGLCAETPGRRQYIDHILAEEQEVVGKGNDAEQIIGEGIGDQIQQYDGQVKQCKEPGFHRNDEEQQELGIREQGGVAEEQLNLLL